MFLALFGISVVFSLYLLGGRPSRLSFGLGIISALYPAGCAIVHERGLGDLRRAEIPRFQPLDNRPGGHTVTVQALEGVPGLSVSLFQEASSLTPEQIWGYRWRASAGGVSIHVHDVKCDCKAPSFELLSHWSQSQRGGKIELEYLVAPETSPALSQVQLRISYPRSYENDIAIGKGLFGYTIPVNWTAAAIGLCCGLVHYLRLRARGRATSVRPASS